MLLTLLAAATLASQANPAGAEVTIYNQGFALVKQNRSVHLEKGRQRISIEDVASSIEPESVAFMGLGKANAFTVLEQNYQFDLISPQAILNKSVGSKIRFIRVLPNSQKEVVTGTLVSSPTAVVNTGNGSEQTYNGMVIRTDDGRIILDPTGEIEVSSIPEGLITRPTLVWDIDSAQSGDTPIELSYLAQQINWNADYVLTLNDASTTADLLGWVTLTNQCGATFKNAQLKLMAGDVNRPQDPIFANFATGNLIDSLRSKSQFREQSLFEYHLYTLQRPTDLNNKETKQVSLLEGHGVQTTKKIVFDPQETDGTYYPDSLQRSLGKTSPQVRIEFMNSEANHLGMPLPQGNMKIYERDNSGAVQMVGEYGIQHTPKDEKISLVAGRAFDIVGERKRLMNHKIDSKSYFEKFELTIRNHKAADQKVYWIERHYGDWKITEKSMDFTKLDSDSMQFEVTVPANGSKTIVYSVVTKS